MPLTNAEKQRRYRERKKREEAERKQHERGLPPIEDFEAEEADRRAAVMDAHLAERQELKAAEVAACKKVGVPFDAWELSVLEDPEPEYVARICALIRQAGFDPVQRKRIDHANT